MDIQIRILINDRNGHMVKPLNTMIGKLIKPFDLISLCFTCIGKEYVGIQGICHDNIIFIGSEDTMTKDVIDYLDTVYPTDYKVII